MSEILNLASEAGEAAATVKENFEKSYFDCSKLTWEGEFANLTQHQFEEIAGANRLYHKGYFYSFVNPAAPFVPILGAGQYGVIYELFMNQALYNDELTIDGYSALLLYQDEQDSLLLREIDV